MHGSSSGGAPGKRARIEIIPLIDVIFFLLATFVLFTLSLNKSDGVPVTLPQVRTGEPRDNKDSITISVTDRGTLAYNKEDIGLQEFLEKIREFRALKPEGRVLINGDEAATFSQAVYVLDEVRKAGFEKVFIETRVRADER